MSETAERLGAAVRKLREGAGLTQREVVDRLGEDDTQNWLSRRERGEVEFAVGEIREVERVLHCRPGTVYVLAGLVAPEASARAAIAADSDLTDAMRQVLLSAYDTAIATARASQRPRNDGTKRD